MAEKEKIHPTDRFHVFSSFLPFNPSVPLISNTRGRLPEFFGVKAELSSECGTHERNGIILISYRLLIRDNKVYMYTSVYVHMCVHAW